MILRERLHDLIELNMVNEEASIPHRAAMATQAIYDELFNSQVLVDTQGSEDEE